MFWNLLVAVLGYSPTSVWLLRVFVTLKKNLVCYRSANFSISTLALIKALLSYGSNVYWIYRRNYGAVSVEKGKRENLVSNEFDKVKLTLWTTVIHC